jgi:hypothetical protein
VLGYSRPGGGARREEDRMSIFDRLIGAGKRNGEVFPPYRLVERDYLDEAQKKYARLERLYHQGQKQSWDGHALLKELLAKHGGIRLDERRKAAIAKIFAVILWGELAAWNVSADIAELIEDVEAKMAATGQAFDEARHFYTMRDYLLELGIEIPPLDGYTRAVLIDVLESTSLVEKLIGMQLLVENIAVNLFRAVAKGGVEPVLSELMPYFERDEARHVGLGVMYLPSLLRKLSRLEAARLQLFQVKVSTFVVWGTILLRDAFEALGIDLHDTFRHGIKNQFEIFAAMGRFEDDTRGIYIPRGALARANDLAVDLYFPRDAAARPAWMKFMHGVMDRAARAGETVLGWAA